MPKRTKQKKSILLRLLVLCVSIYMIATLCSLWNELNEEKAKLSSSQKELNIKQSEIDELKNLLKSGSQEEIIEKAARERLGYVYSNEEIFIDISGN